MPVSVEERVWTWELSDTDEVRHQASVRVPVEPSVQVKSRCFDPERRLPNASKVEIDGVVRRRADRRRDPRELRQHAPVHMARGDHAHPRLPPHDFREPGGVRQVLAVHVPDAGNEWRMVQEQERRPVGLAGKTILEPRERTLG